MLNRIRPLSALLLLSLMTGVPNLAHADLAYLQNGEVLTGKVGRMTGEIIGFERARTGKYRLFHSTENVLRLRLTSRNDVVETRKHDSYYGEIFYIDKFFVEMHTKTGTLHIPRINIRNIVLGSPAEVPASGFSSLPSQQRNGNLVPGGTGQGQASRGRSQPGMPHTMIDHNEASMQAPQSNPSVGFNPQNAGMGQPPGGMQGGGRRMQGSSQSFGGGFGAGMGQAPSGASMTDGGNQRRMRRRPDSAQNTTSDPALPEGMNNAFAPLPADGGNATGNPGQN